MKIPSTYTLRMLAAVLAIGLGVIVARAQQLTFTGTNKQPIEVAPDAASGLAKLYVLDGTKGVKATYRASSATATVKCSRFSSLGGAYAEPIIVTRQGDKVSFTLEAGDMGYILEDDGRQNCFWVVDYALHRFDITDFSISSEADCQSASLTIAGRGDRIPYSTINGRTLTLSRELSLEYYTLEFDAEAFAYRQVQRHDDLEYVDATLAVPAPLCATDFTLAGDRFLAAWGEEISATATGYTPIAVEASTVAEQAESTAENEIHETTDGLGGSAPVEITFKAAVTDAVVFREWQISRDQDFNSIENSFRELETTYTFTDNGTTYVRFVVADASGACEFTCPTFSVFVGESKLTCPNAFSPGASPGINDEWRVSYKSIISYECHIFNRWGKEVFAATDPALGWDGRHGGKLVPAGVYYYVIKAQGADGVDYKLSGDINIVNYNAGTGYGSGESAE